MRVGFVNGCFDLFHEGHRHLLEEARKRCDYLIVAVNSDRSVRRLKGDDRPYWDFATRADELFESGLPDAVIPFDGDEQKLIEAIHPDVWVRGDDHAETLLWSDWPVTRVTDMAGGWTMETVYIERTRHSTTERARELNL